MAADIDRTLDFTELPPPPDLDPAREASFVAESKTVEVPVANKTVKIYTEQVSRKDGEPVLDVLFLHGMRFSSQTWLEVMTLHKVAGWGYRAVAIDLPGIPTLILVGTKDTVNGKESTADLKHLANSTYAPIEGASHPCYLDNPDAWHTLLYHFLKHLSH